MSHGGQYRLGRFTVDPARRRLRFGAETVEIPYRSFEALTVLLEAGGGVVDREELHRRIWPDAVVDETSLNKCVSELRRSLTEHDSDAEYVETVRGRGYRLAQPVEAFAADPPEAAPAGFRWRTATAAGLGIAMVAAAVWTWRGDEKAERVASLRAEGVRAYQARDYPAAAAALREAIRIDPDNGRAYGELAHVAHRMRDPTSDAAQAIELAEKGVALAPECAECRGTLGFFLFYHGWEWERAQQQYADALRLDPAEASIRSSYALLLAAMGEVQEAVEQAEQAVADAPLAAGRWAVAAQVLYAAQRYDETIAAADRAIGMDRRRNEAWEYRARAELRQGRWEDAVRTMLAERYKEHEVPVGAAVDEGGGEAGLRKLLELTGGWPERSEVSWRRAAWFAALGEDDAALAALEEAAEQRNINLMLVAVDPLYSRLRGRPRFQTLLEKMGLSATAEEHTRR